LLYKESYVKGLIQDHTLYTSIENGPDCPLEREEERLLLC